MHPPVRFYRSTREAFPSERFHSIFGPYRPPLRFWRVFSYFCLFALFALFGVLLAYRG
jgi:hypothetical protein